MVKRILLIGATGLLGESVARGLGDAGFSVRMMSRNVSRARLEFPERFEVVEGDGMSRKHSQAAMLYTSASTQST